MVKLYTQLFIFLVLSHSVLGSKGSPVKRGAAIATISSASTCKATPFDGVPAIYAPRYIHSTCSAEQKWADRVAWSESGLLANAMSQWKPQGDYQRAIDFFLGPTHLNLSSASYKTKYLPRIEKLIALQDMLYKGKAGNNTAFYVYCGEDELPASFFDGKDQTCAFAASNNVNHKPSCCATNTLSYSWIDKGSALMKFVTVLCPKFFEMTTMANDVRYLVQHADQRSDPYKLMYNSGGVHFHQSIYWAAALSNMTINNLDQGNEALTNMQEVQIGNETLEGVWNGQYAEPWREAAIAMFQMQTFCLADSPHETWDDPPGTMYVSIETLDGPHSRSLGDISTPWVGPQDPNDSKSLPNMTQWVKTQPQPVDKKDYAAYTASPTPTPSCIGVIQDKQDIPVNQDREGADREAEDFCSSQNSKILDPKNTSITRTVFPKGGGQSMFTIVLADKEECKVGFEVDGKACTDIYHSIIDSCIGGDIDQAWGGSVVFGCGIYYFEPWTHQGPPQWLGYW